MTDQSREIESRVTSFLDDISAQYEVVEIDPDFADTINFCEKYGFPIETSGNTIIVASKRGAKKHSASVVRADKRLDVNHKVCELMDIKRASFAKADETSEITGMMIGGVTCLASRHPTSPSTSTPPCSNSHTSSSAAAADPPRSKLTPRFWR